MVKSSLKQRLRSTISTVREKFGRKGTRRQYGPFDQLSVEIIAEIFMFAVSSPRIAFEIPSWSFPQNCLDIQWMTSNPLFLCTVCQRWRYIAFSTQELWVEIKPRFRKPLKDGYEQRLLQQWIERSGTHPISLKLSCNFYRIRDKNRNLTIPRSVVSDMKEDLLSIAHRCRVLDVGMNIYRRNTGGYHEFISDDIAHFLSLAMPSLEELRFWGYYHQRLNIDAYPRLKTLVWINVATKIDLTGTSTHGLRRLMTTACLEEMYQILSYFPSLVDCVFLCNMDNWWHFIRQTVLIAPQTPLLSLHHLESLCMKCIVDDSSPLWDQLYLPSLKVACLDLPSRVNNTTLWRSLYACFQRSCSPLVHLELHMRVILPEHEFIELLSWMPSLKRLRVEFGEKTLITGMFWRALNGKLAPEDTGRGFGTAAHYQDSLTNQPICPHLEYLHLYTFTHFELEDIIETISSRFLDNNHLPSIPDATATGLHTLRVVSIAGCGFTLDDLLSVRGLQKTVTAEMNTDRRIHSQYCTYTTRLAVRSVYTKPTDKLWKFESYLP